MLAVNGGLVQRSREPSGTVSMCDMNHKVRSLLPTFSAIFGLAFVADEETGSKYGIAQLLDTGIFNEDDLIVVPDSGTEEGNIIEVAEKSILWLKVVVNGKQGHASRPDLAVNASKLGMIFMLSIEKSLHEKFNASDKTFEYPLSTFSITKHEKNVDNINTIPGTDPKI